MKQPLQFLLALILCTLTLGSIAGNKTPINSPAFNNTTNEIKMLSSFLYTAGGNIADGNRVVFDAQYSNAIDGNDALKLMNPGENFAILRDGRTLAVEARQPIANGDTLFYSMSNLYPQVYRLDIAPQNLAGTNITCRLIDRYLNTAQTINLSDSNHFAIQVTSDPASKAGNRLLVVFSNTIIPAPFRFSNISANNNNRTVMINWQVSNEMNVAFYEIERSSDNIKFFSLSTKLPFHNDVDSIIYKYNDDIPLENDNIYRIKSVSLNGVPVYSDKVKVSIEPLGSGMNIYPNPVTNHHFQVRFLKMRAGKYYLRITNNSGQQLYTIPVNITSNYITQTIGLDLNIVKGDYNVSMWNDDGIVCTEKLIVQ